MIYERLKKHYESDRAPFSMPGHKKSRSLPPELMLFDTTELCGGVDLHHLSDDVRESMGLLSQFYKSDKSFYMTGGSTAGVHASIMAHAKTGDTIALTRTCHMSAVNFCAAAGIDAVMIPQRINPEFLIPEPVRAEDIERALCEYPGIKLVMITSPSYYGQCADIAAISKVCRCRGIPLIVDAAHGAHFITGAPYPETAISQGADIEINSAHKTLNALTGAAYIHIRGTLADTKRLESALSMVQSSSPSYPILASAEYAWLELSEKPDMWQETARKCARLKENAEIRFLDNDDPSRLVMCFSDYEITGFEAEEYLTDAGIDVEMSDFLNVVLITSPNNTDRDFDRLASAVNSLVKTLSPRKTPPEIAQPDSKLVFIRPQAGFWGTDARLSDKTVMIYPPGTPIVAMGEVKKEELI